MGSMSDEYHPHKRNNDNAVSVNANHISPTGRDANIASTVKGCETPRLARRSRILWRASLNNRISDFRLTDVKNEERLPLLIRFKEAKIKKKT